MNYKLANLNSSFTVQKANMEELSNKIVFSIGDVLEMLKQEFPDITISKIRFLESQGIIKLQRTPTGFRKFYPEDIEKLRWVLKQQKENFLPLKVIKKRLDNHPSDNQLPLQIKESSYNKEVTTRSEDKLEEQKHPSKDESSTKKVEEFNEYSRQWLVEQSGSTRQFIETLLEYKLITPKFIASLETFSKQDLEVAKISWSLNEKGIEPRHLKSLQLVSARLVDSVCSIYQPLISTASEANRVKLAEDVLSILNWLKEIFSVMIEQNYSDQKRL